MPLEIYVIDDSEALPDDPGALLLIGTIELREHQALGRGSSIPDLDVRLPYFDDHRLSATEVRSLRDDLFDVVDTGAGPNIVVVELVAALDLAIERGCGIATFAD